VQFLSCKQVVEFICVFCLRLPLYSATDLLCAVSKSLGAGHGLTISVARNSILDQYYSCH